MSGVLTSGCDSNDSTYKSGTHLSSIYKIWLCAYARSKKHCRVVGKSLTIPKILLWVSWFRCTSKQCHYSLVMHNTNDFTIQFPVYVQSSMCKNKELTMTEYEPKAKESEGCLSLLLLRRSGSEEMYRGLTNHRSDIWRVKARLVYIISFHFTVYLSFCYS